MDFSLSIFGFPAIPVLRIYIKIFPTDLEKNCLFSCIISHFSLGLPCGIPIFGVQPFENIVAYKLQQKNN